MTTGNKQDQSDWSLAISGGGIRSATFALGLIQTLAKYRLLERMECLSTVSGGGYIGSWLMAYLYRGQKEQRKDLERLQEEIVPRPDGDKALSDDEAPPIRWLREYSNYLSPSLSLMSADSWSIATIYARNALLNLVPHLLLLAGVLLLPYCLAYAFDPVRFTANNPGRVLVWWGAGATFLLAAAGLSAKRLSALTGTTPGRKTGPGAGQTGAILIALILGASAWCASVVLWRTPFLPAGEAQKLFWPTIAVVGLSGMAMFVASVREWFQFSGMDADNGRPLAEVVIRSLLAVAAGAGTYGVILGVLAGLQQAIRRWEVGHGIATYVFGPPIMLLLYAMVVILLIGFAGPYMKDEVREWWSRQGAWLLIFSLGAGLVNMVALYGPILVLWLWQTSGVAAGAAGAGWLGTLWAGLRGGWSPATSGKEEEPGWKDKLVPLAPPIIVLGLLLMIATGLQEGMLATKTSKHENPWSSTLQSAPTFKSVRDASIARVEEIGPWTPFSWLGIAAVLCAALMRLFDVNECSMHRFYRNRLVRCYLGASRTTRRPEKFTNLDPEDDLPLVELRSSPDTLQLPVHLVNAAVNLSDPELGKQERRAESFVFTPFECGYSSRGYRYIEKLDAARKAHQQLSLGEAFAISGAAASPNMGYHSSAPVAFLLTLFNVRLGWWFMNPGQGRTWEPRGPKWGAPYYLADLFSLASDTSRHVYLSDGGHFENLAVYELIRRRKKYILCCDGEEDGAFAFGGLGGLIRKARIDFGVEIQIDASAICRLDEKGLSEEHCAVGIIRYPKTPDAPAETGIFVYVKSAVTGDEPRDVLQYRQDNPEFPHQSTGDQFFSESQFESYRRLGIHAAEALFQPVSVQLNCDVPMPAARLFADLHQAWRGTPAELKENFTSHSLELSRLVDRLRNEPQLLFLFREIYPAWQSLGDQGVLTWRMQDMGALPEDVFARAFGLCQNMIQLMENVYLDLRMDTNYNHPDCAGWTNQFRHWSGSNFFKLTYAIAAPTFGARFNKFCENHLHLSLGKVVTGGALTVAQVQPSPDLNWVEKELLGRFTDEAMKSLFVKAIFTQVRPGLCLPVGCLVYRGSSTKSEALIWIRVQNHVRKRGIGRAALAWLEPGTSIASTSELKKLHKDGKFDPDDPRFMRNYDWVRRTLALQHATAIATGKAAGVK